MLRDFALARTPVLFTVASVKTKFQEKKQSVPSIIASVTDLQHFSSQRCAVILAAGNMNSARYCGRADLARTRFYKKTLFENIIFTKTNITLYKNFCEFLILYFPPNGTWDAPFFFILTSGPEGFGPLFWASHHRP